MKLNIVISALVSLLFAQLGCSGSGRSLATPGTGVCLQGNEALSTKLGKEDLNHEFFEKTTLTRGKPASGEADLTEQGVYVFNGVEVHYVKADDGRGGALHLYKKKERVGDQWETTKTGCISTNWTDADFENLSSKAVTIQSMELSEKSGATLENRALMTVELGFPADANGEQHLKLNITEADPGTLQAPKDIYDEADESVFFRKLDTAKNPNGEFELRSKYVDTATGVTLNVAVHYKLCVYPKDKSPEQKSIFEACTKELEIK